MISLSSLSMRLKNEKSVALICHVKPDGDAIGSLLGLYYALTSLHIKVDMYCEDNVPQKFMYLKDTDKIKNTDIIAEDYTALVALDSADMLRIGKYCLVFSKFKNTFNIDHHISNGYYARKNYVVENSSNSENIYDIITAMEVVIDKDIANALATGIITDSGTFRHKTVTENTLKTATALFSYGADFHTICYNVSFMQSKERAALFGKIMSHIRYFLDDKMALATIRLKDFEETGALKEETEGFIDFIMGIRGVEVGVCIMETEQDKYKVSFRAENADVNSVAATFGGGGHMLASGCKLCGAYEEVVDKIVFAVSRVIEI